MNLARPLLPMLGLVGALALRAASPGPLPAGAPVFEVLPSTRTVTWMLAVGPRLLVGTTGGLRSYAGGAWHLLFPGVPIRGLSPDPEHAGQALATTDAGLFRIGPGGETLVLAGACSAAGVRSGQILVARPDGPLVHLDGSAGPPSPSGPAPLHTLVEHEGVLWAASLDGLWRVESPASRERVGPGELAGHVTALAILGGRLFAGTPVGLFERVEKAWRPVACESKHPPHVTALALDPHGRPLVGTAGDGVWRLEAGRLRPWKRDPPEVTALACREGEVWAGTPERGPLAITGASAPPRIEGAEPPSNAITSLAWAREWQTLVVGTFDRGVGLFRDGAWRRAGLDAGLPSDWINQVASDGNRVLARLSDGNVYASLGSNEWKPLGRAEGWPKPWTSALGSDRDRLWAGTRNAFLISLQDKWEVFAPKPGLEGVDVLDVALRDSEAWLATHRHGLLRTDRWRQRFDRFTSGTGLPDPWVTAVEVFRGRVYAGTFDGGLVEVVDDGPGTAVRTFRKVEAGTGSLPSGAINCLLATDEALWIGTLDGLAATRDGATFQRFGLADGLPSTNITCLASDGARLWVGTQAGLARATIDGGSAP